MIQEKIASLERLRQELMAEYAELTIPCGLNGPKGKDNERANYVMHHAENIRAEITALRVIHGIPEEERKHSKENAKKIDPEMELPLAMETLAAHTGKTVLYWDDYIFKVGYEFGQAHGGSEWSAFQEGVFTWSHFFRFFNFYALKIIVAALSVGNDVERTVKQMITVLPLKQNFIQDFNNYYSNFQTKKNG
jgi:hypothetical protein